MKTFEFYDKVTGEIFFVEAKEKEHSIWIAECFFEKPVFLGEVSRLEAEMLGYDTY